MSISVWCKMALCDVFFFLLQEEVEDVEGRFTSFFKRMFGYAEDEPGTNDEESSLIKYSLLCTYSYWSVKFTAKILLSAQNLVFLPIIASISF